MFRSTAFAAKALVASLVVAGGLAGFTSQAQAREISSAESGYDSISIYCYALQEESRALVHEYWHGASAARKEQIKTRLGEIGHFWLAGCEGTFGTLTIRLLPETMVDQQPVTNPVLSPQPSPTKATAPAPVAPMPVLKG